MLYEPEDKQAFRQKLESSQLPAALAFLTARASSARSSTSLLVAVGVGKPRDYVLSLRRAWRSPGQGDHLRVDPDTFLVRESGWSMPRATSTTCFSDIKIGRPVGQHVRWSPPPARA